MSGCYVVDDLLLVTRWLIDDVPIEGDPVRNPAPPCTIPIDGGETARPEGERALSCPRRRTTGAEGVIFAAPSFCDPALLDRPMLQHVLKDISAHAFKYASGQMQLIREQAGTFAD